MSVSKETWIAAGYAQFAIEGYHALKVERVAKQVGISKSSFYHHFIDFDTFVAYLLEHHLHRASELGAKERQTRQIMPDLVDLLLEYRTDLLFSRELRIHCQAPAFASTLQDAARAMGDSFSVVWIREINMQLNPNQLQAFFALAVENFALQLNAETLNREWLSQYFSKLKRIASAFA